VVNRMLPVFRHLLTLENMHPASIYRECVALAGELATFMAPEKLAPTFPPYQHDDLTATYQPVIRALRQYLSAVLEQTATSIPLDPRKYGISVGVIADRKLISTAGFVLAVKADSPAETLPVAPRQIPYHAGVVYFELDRDSPYWRKMTTSGGIAVHVSGDYPGLTMELWAVRQG
jgi:type VI secretion system protein ImpJ